VAGGDKEKEREWRGEGDKKERKENGGRRRSGRRERVAWEKKKRWFAKQDLPLEQSVIDDNNKVVDEQIKNLQQSIPLAEKRIQRDLFYKELLKK
jgi:hypothetical protein